MRSSDFHHVQVNEQFTTYTAADVAEGLQDFLICIEMFLAAMAHAYAFPPRVSSICCCVQQEISPLCDSLESSTGCRCLLDVHADKHVGSV